MTQHTPPFDPGADPDPITKRRARHILNNAYIGPARDTAVLEIWGYTDRISYAPGDRVDLHVSTTALTWDLEVRRDAPGTHPALTRCNLPGQAHDTPVDCSAQGCGWPVALSFEVPADWPSGGYLMTLTGHRDGQDVTEHHLIVVRAGQTRARMLLLCATPTWIAYNCWGGSNAYEGITGAQGRNFSPVLSTQRPWTRGLCHLPAGAPRALPDRRPRAGEMPRYPYMEWAYAYGYSRKYASAGWASYERHFIYWAQEAGYDCDVATLHDLESDPALLDDYACVVHVGHDEYWTRPMRDAIDTWVDAGGRVARFAGNFLWQVRLEDQGRRQICYKYDARFTDPVAGTDRAHLLTDAWEARSVGHPGALTFGVNGLRGVYAGLGDCAGRGAGGFTVYRPDHWAFAGAGLGYGDVLGADAQIFGYEVDGLDHIIRDGLPEPTGTDGAAADIRILAMGLATNIEPDHGIWGAHRYLGESTPAWIAEALHGQATAETTASAARGSGMMIHWPKGRGEVFTAATCEWVNGLRLADRQVDRVTRNVLDRFLT